MPKASHNTIRRTADLTIGENLIFRSWWVPVRCGGCPVEQNTHQLTHTGAFYTRMKKNDARFSRARVTDCALAAMEQMELYCQAHPGSPAAVRRPRLFVRGDLWVALLGPSVDEGIVGIGPTVTAALRAFDAQYLAGLRPPSETIGNNGIARSTSSMTV